MVHARARIQIALKAAGWEARPSNALEHWEPDFDKLAAAAALANWITNGRIDLRGAETDISAHVWACVSAMT
jgi:hypothetical protein